MSNEQKYMCEICGRRFTRSYNLNNHIKVKHEYVSLKYFCYLCRKNFKKQDDYLKNIENRKEGLSSVLYKALHQTIQIFRKHLKDYFSLNDIFNEAENIQKLFDSQLLLYPKYKCNVLVQIEYILRGADNTTLEKEIFNIRTSNFIISKTFSKKYMKKIINKHLFEILGKEKDMNLPQSGWISNKIIMTDVNLHKMNMLL